jgi:DNA repair exonuclease SbcCD ATPase subunit
LEELQLKILLKLKTQLQMSKIERIVILAILITLGALFVLMLFTTTDPKPQVDPQVSEYKNSLKELEEDNKELQELLDSIRTEDSLRILELRKAKTDLNNKKNEITKIIKFLPDADTKFRDSLWTVYLKN